MLIDDHSRFKFVYFLKNKSEAPKKAAEFVAQFNHAASSKSVTSVRMVGQHLHMNNAGEFLSREFKDFLDEELISQTTCPPHVHQLNGVRVYFRVYFDVSRVYSTVFQGTSFFGARHPPTHTIF